MQVENISNDFINRLARESTVKEITALFEVSNRLRESQDINTILREIILISKEILSAEACTLGLLDEGNFQIDFHIVTGEKSEKLKDVSVRPGQGILGCCVKQEATINVPDVSADERFDDSFDESTDFKTRSILCVPMIHQQKCIGAIEVINKLREAPEFTETDEKVLNIIADQAAAAIEYGRIQQALAQEQRMATIGSMASHIIHDLKNPLSVIRISAELISAKFPESEKRTSAVIRESERIYTMIQEILNFSKGSSHMEFISVDLSAFMHDLYQVAEMLLEGKNIALKKGSFPDTRIRVDSERMRRALLNIFSNAIDVMKEGDSLSVCVELKDDQLIFQVEDTGSGMDDETLQNVFEPMFSRKKKGGFGLGMAITKSIVEGHNGTIDVESTLGQGTVFRINIPIS
ncbi:MAG TPA: GAF domain-containing sensor histidine kinase [Verrucomicrobiales bacterium]|nr:GAF domain-containing sensor histidine kinase [Verrucomicrobiales bacterium]